MNFSKEEKAMWLERWRLSEKKAWTFAKESGIHPQTFCGWVKRELKSKCGFVEIPKARHGVETQAVVIEKEGFVARIPLALGMEGLRTVFRALGVVP